MFTNKLNPNGGGKKMYTQTKEKKEELHTIQYLLEEKKKQKHLSP